MSLFRLAVDIEDTSVRFCLLHGVRHWRVQYRFFQFHPPLQRIPPDCYVSFVHLCYTKRALHNIILLFCNMCRYYVIKVYSRLSATTLPENRIRYNISIFLSSRHILWILYLQMGPPFVVQIQSIAIQGGRDLCYNITFIQVLNSS